MNSGSGLGLGSEAGFLEDEDGSLGMRGVKKDWRERRDSKAYCGGELGVMKVRISGRLLM